MQIFHHCVWKVQWFPIDRQNVDRSDVPSANIIVGDFFGSVWQVGECLRALGQNPTESDVKKCTHQLKPDERISFEVFLPIYHAISKARSGDTADDFIEGLRHFDKDASGFISTAELRHLLTTLGEKLTDDEVEQLLVNQEDSQGNVNYEEFVRVIMSGWTNTV